MELHKHKDLRTINAFSDPRSLHVTFPYNTLGELVFQLCVSNSLGCLTHLSQYFLQSSNTPYNATFKHICHFTNLRKRWSLQIQKIISRWISISARESSTLSWLLTEHQAWTTSIKCGLKDSTYASSSISSLASVATRAILRAESYRREETWRGGGGGIKDWVEISTCIVHVVHLTCIILKGPESSSVSLGISSVWVKEEIAQKYQLHSTHTCTSVSHVPFLGTQSRTAWQHTVQLIGRWKPHWISALSIVTLPH